MKIWKAKIKERNNPHLLTPSYTFHETQNPASREDMVEFWGLDGPDVEWYELELSTL